MKKLLTLTLIGLAASTLLTGCLAIQLGGGTTNRTQPQNPTIGQQLADLKHARDVGAISEMEYEVQKDKILTSK